MVTGGSRRSSGWQKRKSATGSGCGESFAASPSTKVFVTRRCETTILSSSTISIAVGIRSKVRAKSGLASSSAASGAIASGSGRRSTSSAMPSSLVSSAW